MSTANITKIKNIPLDRTNDYEFFKLIRGAEYFEKLRMSGESKSNFTPIQNQSEARIKIIDDCIGIKGKYCKFSFEPVTGAEEQAVYYTERKNLLITQAFNDKYTIALPYTAYSPPKNFFPENTDTIQDWYQKERNVTLFDIETQQYYCCVEYNYEQKEATLDSGMIDYAALTNPAQVTVTSAGEVTKNKKGGKEQDVNVVVTVGEKQSTFDPTKISEYAKGALIQGLKVIYSEAGKKFDYLDEGKKQAYFFAEVKEWMPEFRPCGNVLFLVTLPKKYLFSNQVSDVDRTAEESVVSGQLNISRKDLISSSDLIAVQLPFLSITKFEEKIKLIANFIHSKFGLQEQYGTDECNEFIGGLDLSIWYAAIELNLKEEAEKFIRAPQSSNKDFFQTVKDVLIANKIEIDREYTDVTQNNIVFYLDKKFNIVKFDILRNNKFYIINKDLNVYSEPFGNGGFVSMRSVYLLYGYAASWGLLADSLGSSDKGFRQEWAETNNTLGYKEFVQYFIIPPPNPINLPRRDKENCVKNYAAKLAEDSKRIWAQTQAFSETIEFSMDAARLERSKYNKEFRSTFDSLKAQGKLDSSANLPPDYPRNVYGQRYNSDNWISSSVGRVPFIGEATANTINFLTPDVPFSALATRSDEFQKELKDQTGFDTNNIPLSTFRYLRDFLNKKNIQRLIIKSLICSMKTQDQRGSMKVLKGTFGDTSWLKKQLEAFFCNPAMEKFLTITGAINIPKFRPLNLNDAMRKAITKALVSTIAQAVELVLTGIVESLSACKSEASPFNPQQEDAINDALDKALKNAEDDPFSNNGLNGALDAIGSAPQVNPNNPGDQSQDKKDQLKNYVADIACLLNSFEICEIFSGNPTPGATQVVKSLLLKKYPDLFPEGAENVSADKIFQLFKNLGTAINIKEICEAYKILDPETVANDNDCYCSPDSNADKIHRNVVTETFPLLTPKEIDDIIQKNKDNRQKRLENLFDILSNGINIPPIFCTPESEGTENAAQTDTTYADQVNELLQGSIEPVIEIFKSDLKDWAKNNTEKVLFNLTDAQLEILRQPKPTPAEGESDADNEAIKRVLLESGIAIEQSGSLVINPNPPQARPLISPIISGSIFDPSRIESNTDGTPVIDTDTGQPAPSYYKFIDGSQISVSTSAEKAKKRVESALRAQLAMGLEQRLRQIAVEQKAVFGQAAWVGIVELISEIIASIITAVDDDSSLDPGFLIGLNKAQREQWASKFGAEASEYPSWMETGAFILAGLTGLFSILDRMFDLSGFAVDDNSLKETYDIKVNLLTTTYTEISQRSSPRSLYYRDQGSLSFSKVGEQIAATTEKGNTVGVVNNDLGFASYRTVNEAYIRGLEEKGAQQQISVDQAKAIFDEAKGRVDALAKDAPKEVRDPLQKAANEAEAAWEASGSLLNNTSGSLDSAKENKAFVESTEELDSTTFFEKANSYFTDLDTFVGYFQESTVYKQLVQLADVARNSVKNWEIQTKEAIGSYENARKTLKTLNDVFPNYELIYSSGKIPDQSSLVIKKNGNNFISSSFRETIDPDIKELIVKEGLLENYNIDSPYSQEEFAFINYCRKRGFNTLGSDEIISKNYRLAKKEIFQDIYSILKNSSFFKTEGEAYNSLEAGQNGFYRAFIENLTSKSLKFELTDGADAPCQYPDALDVDQLVKDTLQDFINNDCNHEAPDPLGRPRDKMHPVEEAISFGYMIATLRVYIYDYYLKGIFLFDKNKIGMTATDPMLDFLANVIEVEMSNFDQVFYNRFLETAMKYGQVKYRQIFSDLMLLYGRDGVLASYGAKRIVLKRIIQDEILYISKKASENILAYADTDRSIADTEKSVKYFKENNLGVIAKFFKDRAAVIQAETNPTRILSAELVKNDLGHYNAPRTFTVNKKTEDVTSPVNFPANDSITSDFETRSNQGFNGVIVYFLGRAIKVFDNDKKIKIDNQNEIDIPMARRTEYKFLFEYCFPIRKYYSLITMQQMLAASSRPESNNTFAATKAFIRSRQARVMEAPGIKTNPNLSDPSSSRAPIMPGSGNAAATFSFILPMIIKTLIRVPWELLKGVSEAGDINVFLASLPYNILKPIMLATTNQIPKLPDGSPAILSTSMQGVIPKVENAKFSIERKDANGNTMYRPDENGNQIVDTYEVDSGVPSDPGAAILRSLQLSFRSLSFVTPILGIGLSWFGLLPSSFGIFYYILGCWMDDMLENEGASNTDSTNLNNVINGENNIPRLQVCPDVIPKVIRAELPNTEYYGIKA